MYERQSVGMAVSFGSGLMRHRLARRRSVSAEITVTPPAARGLAGMDLITTPAPTVRRGIRDGFATLTLAAGELEASFAPQLGMAGVSLLHAGDELLDRRAGLAAYADDGAVMGLPLLHPWANRLSGFGYTLDGRTVRLPDGPPLVRCEEHGLPIHGLLNGSPLWRVDGASADSDREHARLRASLRFEARPGLLSAFRSRTSWASTSPSTRAGSPWRRPSPRPGTSPCPWPSGSIRTSASRGGPVGVAARPPCPPLPLHRSPRHPHGPSRGRARGAAHARDARLR
jgi:hypothetical protein